MSRPKLDLPLKDRNSPRSQWISNVSLLKNQLKDGKLVESGTEVGTKLSWNEFESQLSKRRKEPSMTDSSRQKTPGLSERKRRDSVPKSPNNLKLIPYPRYHARPWTPSDLSTLPKRPTLKIPTSPKSKEILKKVHGDAVQTPSLPVRLRSTLSPTKNDDDLTETPSPDQGKASVPHGRTPTKSALTVETKVNTDTSPVFKALHGTTSTPEVDKLLRVKEDSRIVEKKIEVGTIPVFKALNEPTSTIEVNKPLKVKEDSHNVGKKIHVGTIPVEVDKRLKVKEDSHNVGKKIHVGTTPVEGEKPLNVKEDSHIEDKTIQVREENQTTKSEQYSNARESLSRRHDDLSEKPDALKASSVFSPNSVAPSVTTLQAIGSFATTPNKVPRHARSSPKTKGSLSWLRRALAPQESSAKKTATLMNSSSSSVREEKTSEDQQENTSVEKHFHPTTPLQLGLWVSELKKAIRVAQQEQKKGTCTVPINVVDSCPDTHKQPEGFNQQNEVRNTEEDLYYKKNLDVGVYVDYSTFDDGDSVSSLELLFKWLTCRDLNETDNKRSDGTITPPGTVIATESNVSDDISIDMDVKPTRRTFFAR